MSDHSVAWTRIPRKRHILWAVFATVLSLAALGVASPTSASATSCVRYVRAVSPLDPQGLMAPTSTPGGCYATESQAEAAAAANAPTASSVQIGIDWENSGADGDSLVWYGADGGCDSNTKYEDSYIGDAWDNRVSSAGGKHNCSAFVHFQYRNFNENHPEGDYIRCGILDTIGWCIHMGSMNDRTSSEKWHVAVG
jgi:hypothetical protein